MGQSLFIVWCRRRNMVIWKILLGTKVPIGTTCYLAEFGKLGLSAGGVYDPWTCSKWFGKEYHSNGKIYETMSQDEKKHKNTITFWCVSKTLNILRQDVSKWTQNLLRVHIRIVSFSKSRRRVLSECFQVTILVLKDLAVGTIPLMWYLSERSRPMILI